MAAVDIASYADKISDEIQSADREFRLKLDDVQKAIKTLGWRGVNVEQYLNEIGTVTFDSFSSVVDSVNAISFEPVQFQDFTTDIKIDHTHIFESDSLEVQEDAITEFISTGGTGAMKELGAAMVSQEAVNALLAGLNVNDSHNHGRHLSLLDMYASDDTQANKDWLETRYSYKQEDRKKNIFHDLFALAQKNYKFATKTQTTIEELHASFTSSYSGLVASVTKANLAAYSAEVSANIEELEANLKKIATEIDVASLQLHKDSAEYALIMKQAASRVKNYVHEYSAVIAYNQRLLEARIKGGHNVAKSYQSIFAAYSQAFTGLSIGES